ncbi:MAG: hypothetical protein ACRDPY_40195 [Streptosporangiaceae bacterium]
MISATGHEHCIRCGRRLVCTISRKRGYGWGCWAKVVKARKLAALVNFTMKQVEDARQMLDDAAVIPTALATVFRTVSSDGLRVYLTTRSRWESAAPRRSRPGTRRSRTLTS